MKIVESRDEVLVGGAQSVDVFTIKASAKAFQILSANLYSNPLGSMIRELSTNAYDAHIMVGKKEEPFLITLPNSLEPTFKIRDFGPGLSHAQIMSVYTTFFESTKTDSNDMVGCLGLGSKSPFGVADSFTVTSYFNGTKTIYSSFLNDARIPSIAKFAEVETDEENGLEIEVAIKSDNFHTFSKEVNNQLKYFKTKPIVKGNSDFKWHPDEEYLYEGTGWKMVRGGNGPRVIQGQIQYPISTRDMGKVFDTASYAVQELLQRSVLFEVNIGDVNIAPSREALSYDERTSKNIVAAAERILLELPGKLIGAIEGCETEYEARLKYSDLISDLNRGHYGRGAIAKAVKDSGQITWHGKDVSELGIEFKLEDIITATKFTTTYRGRFQKNNYSSYGKRDSTERHWEFQATPLDSTIWVFAKPGDKAVDARSKQYVAGKRDFILNIIHTNLSLAKLAAKFGLKASTFVIAADLPKVVRTKTSTVTGKPKISVVTYNKSHTYNKSDNWIGAEVDKITDLKGFYVNVERYDAIDNNGKMVNDLKMYIAGAIELGLMKDGDVVYGLRPALQKKKHTLVNLFDHITTASKKLTLNNKYEWQNDGVMSKFIGSSDTTAKVVKKISPTSPAYEVLNALVNSTNTSYSGNAQRLINGLNLQPGTVNMRHHNKTMDKLYPMISQMGNYYPDAAAMAQYITDMDLLRELQAKQPV